MISLILFAAMMQQQWVCQPSNPMHCAVMGAVEPEPMDVPAISDHADLRNMTHRECRDLQVEKALDWAASDYGVKPTVTFIHDGDESVLGTCRYAYYACADKSRILLTAEDGTRHCIKFDPAATYRLGDAVELERRKK